MAREYLFSFLEQIKNVQYIDYRVYKWVPKVISHISRQGSLLRLENLVSFVNVRTLM